MSAKFLKKYVATSHIVVLSILALAMSGALFCVALLSGRLINSLTNDTSRSAVTATLMLIGIVVYSILYASSGHLETRYSLSGKNLCIKDMHERIIRGKYSLVKTYHSVELLSAITTDAEVAIGNYVRLIPLVISTAIKLIIGVAILLVINHRLTLIMLGIGIIVGAIIVFTRVRIKSLHKKAIGKSGELKAYMQESIENIEVIKLFGYEQSVSSAMNTKLREVSDIVLKKSDMLNIINATVYFLLELAFIGVLSLGAYEIIKGSFALANFVVLISIISIIKEPFKTATGLSAIYTTMIGSAERLAFITELEQDQPLEVGSFSRITFHEVSFAYEDHYILRDVDCSINKGDKIALVGATGEGKSTFIKLLMGLLTPTSGEIIVNEHTPLSGIPSFISYVPQRNMLFSGTILDNLTTRNVPMDKVIWATKIAGIYDDIMLRKDGFDTVLTEDNGMSVGQFQRLAIARALLKDSDMLILDEATSALDSDTEQAILARLYELPYTIVCISHRDRALEYSNKIFRLNLGELSYD